MSHSHMQFPTRFHGKHLAQHIRMQIVERFEGHIQPCPTLASEHFGHSIKLARPREAHVDGPALGLSLLGHGQECGFSFTTCVVHGNAGARLALGFFKMYPFGLKCNSTSMCTSRLGRMLVLQRRHLTPHLPHFALHFQLEYTQTHLIPHKPATLCSPQRLLPRFCNYLLISLRPHLACPSAVRMCVLCLFFDG